MPRGIPNSGKRGRKSSASFDLTAYQAEIELHRVRMIGPIDRRIAELQREIEKLNSVKASLGGGAPSGRRGRPPGVKNVVTEKTEDAPTAKRGRGKRMRRSRGDVEKHATDILEFVRSAKNGVTGTEIKKKFGKVIGTVKNYVKQYTGSDLISSGPKTSMKYTVK